MSIYVLYWQIEHEIKEAAIRERRKKEANSKMKTSFWVNTNSTGLESEILRESDPVSTLEPPYNEARIETMKSWQITWISAWLVLHNRETIHKSSVSTEHQGTWTLRGTQGEWSRTEAHPVPTYFPSTWPTIDAPLIPRILLAAFLTAGLAG